MTARRNFLKGMVAGGLATVMSPPLTASRRVVMTRPGARNVIFLVVDGMSQGALALANYYLEHVEGRSMHWRELYLQKETAIHRAMMETTSASSLVPDSAAAGSAWGCGFKVKNGAVNRLPDGSDATPIWIKAKRAGKATGLVSTATITHATPASFAANVKGRNDEGTIATQYLDREIDVLLGGGRKFFSKREDGLDLVDAYQRSGYAFAGSRQDLEKISPRTDRLLGLFSEGYCPFVVDREHDDELAKTVPSLEAMMLAALERLSRNPEGFVLQVESARVDHAGHINDPAALVKELLEFDRCIPIALEFQRAHPDTLIVLTTDHGTGGVSLNGNGRSYRDTTESMARLGSFRSSFDAIVERIPERPSRADLVRELEASTPLRLTDALYAELERLFDEHKTKAEYGPRPVGLLLKRMMLDRTAVGWTSQAHTGEYVELAAWGPGSERVPHFIRNTDVHELVLSAIGVKV